MGYDPQRRRPRPRLTGDEPAPVDEILDEVAHPSAPQWDAPDVVVPEPALGLVADVTPEPVAELHEPDLVAPVPAELGRRADDPTPIAPAVPTPARVADWRAAVAIVSVLALVVVLWRWRRRRRRRHDG